MCVCFGSVLTFPDSTSPPGICHNREACPSRLLPLGFTGATNAPASPGSVKSKRSVGECKPVKQIVLWGRTKAVRSLHTLGTENGKTGEFLVEMTRVELAADRGLPGWCHFSCGQFVPLDFSKEFVDFDLLGIAGSAAQSGIGVPREKSTEESLGLFGQGRRIMQVALADLFKDLLAVLTVERR